MCPRDRLNMVIYQGIQEYDVLTTIKVDSKTRERVKQFRLKDETQEDAINRALDVAESKIAEEGRRSQ